jgi:hypothetical protein
MRRGHNRSFRFIGVKGAIVAAGLAVMLMTGACATTSTSSYREVGVLALSVNLATLPAGDVEVLITAADMDSPIVAQLDVQGQVAWVAVDDVDAGEGRQVFLSFTDSEGQRCVGALDVDVPSDLRTELEVDRLSCGDEGRSTARGELASVVRIPTDG